MPPPTPCSLAYNKIGDEGASALATILKETQISNLGCAAARVFVFLSAPIDTPILSPSPPLARSLGDNNIGDQGASALASILKETQINNLRCAPPPVCDACVSMPLDTLQHPPLLPCARSLRNNRLGPDGAAALAEGLKGNTTLQELE